MIKREELFERAIQDVAEGVLISNAHGLTLFVNRRFVELTGYSLQDMHGKTCSILQGEDTDPVTITALRDALHAGVTFRGEVLNYRKNGTTFWNALTVSPIRNELNAVTHFISLQRDITSRRQNEEALRIAAFAFEVGEGIVVTDLQRCIVKVNHAFERHTGYAQAELLGRPISLLKSGKHDAVFYRGMWESIRQKGCWEGEVWNKRKNGEGYPEWLHIDTVRNVGGEPTHYIGHFTDLTERKSREEALRYRAYHDMLTGLPNRAKLLEKMPEAMAHARRDDKLLAVCMMDLDDFKPINDIHGHAAGDEVLRELAHRLQAVMRTTDTVARLGGDEFVLLLEGIERMEDLESGCRRVQEALVAPITLQNGIQVSVGTSLGAVLFPFDDVDAEILLRHADIALYEQKNNKARRNSFWKLYQAMPVQTLQDCANIMTEGQLLVVYQPVLDLRNQIIVGIEALARWRSSDGLVHMPSEFLPMMQVDDLTALSRMVLAQSLVDLQWLDTLGHDLWVSFNVDPRSLTHGCLQCLREIIVHTGIAPHRVTMEILESGDFLNQADTQLILQGIKNLGLRIALDDVGSAYASLLRMRELQVDEIKLDQGFVRTLDKHPDDIHFIRMIMELAGNLKVDLVIEGVENEAILDALSVIRAPQLQGYEIAPPMPIEDLEHFLSTWVADTRSHPFSLLGVYALHVAKYEALKKAAQQAPDLMDYATLADAHRCSAHHALHRMGYDDEHVLCQLHLGAHLAFAGACACGAMVDLDMTDAWQSADDAQTAFVNEVLKIDGEREQLAIDKK